MCPACLAVFLRLSVEISLTSSTLASELGCSVLYFEMTGLAMKVGGVMKKLNFLCFLSTQRLA